MKVSFNAYKNKLEIERTKNFKSLFLSNFDLSYSDKIDFPQGAHKIEAFYCHSDKFKNVHELLVYVFSFQYARLTSYDIPDSFYEREYILYQLDYKQFEEYINALLYGFISYYQSHKDDMMFWNVTVNLDGFIAGYKVETIGTEQVLIAKLDKYYLYFISQSID